MAKETKRTEKPVRITVYEIHFKEQSTKAPDLNKDLFECLNVSKTIRERLMSLSKDETIIDSDFITAFASTGGFLFGSFARLAAGEESSVSKAILDQKTVSLNDMIKESAENNEGSIKTSSFFCVHKTLLTVTNAQQTIRPLENYINWILNNNNVAGQICFVPKKNTATTIPVKDIRSIQISGDYINAKEETRSQVVSLTKQMLKSFLDVKGKQEFDEENLVSAMLTLKFKQKKNNKEKALDAALKIIDDDDIVVTGKNGKRIRGSLYLVSVIRKIERLGSGIFNEQEIKTAMRSILKDVDNGKVVS